MKAIVKSRPEQGLWLEAVEKPSPGVGEVLIKIRKAAICGTDLHIYQWDDWAQRTIRLPMPIGHEFVGEVVELGEGVSHIKLGDRVSGEGHIVCNTCRNCRAGQRHLCRHTKGVGLHRPGAFADFLVMPESNVCKVPDQISDEVASILDPLGNAVHSVLWFDLVGEDVLITGAGPVGMLAAAVASFIGSRHVVITDVNDYRLGLAKKMGIKHAMNTSKVPLSEVMQSLGMVEGFDVGLEMSGSPTAFQEMLSVMNHGGSIAYLGIPKEQFAIHWDEVIFKGLAIKGIYGRRMFETWYKGMAMLQSGLDVSSVITHRFPATSFEEAFDAVLSGTSGKVILDWEI